MNIGLVLLGTFAFLLVFAGFIALLELRSRARERNTEKTLLGVVMPPREGDR
jgi:hypothetical protein